MGASELRRLRLGRGLSGNNPRVAVSGLLPSFAWLCDPPIWIKRIWSR